MNVLHGDARSSLQLTNARVFDSIASANGSPCLETSTKRTLLRTDTLVAIHRSLARSAELALVFSAGILKVYRKRKIIIDDKL